MSRPIALSHAVRTKPRAVLRTAALNGAPQPQNGRAQGISAQYARARYMSVNPRPNFPLHGFRGEDHRLRTSHNRWPPRNRRSRRRFKRALEERGASRAPGGENAPSGGHRRPRYAPLARWGRWRLASSAPLLARLISPCQSLSASCTRISGASQGLGGGPSSGPTMAASFRVVRVGWWACGCGAGHGGRSTDVAADCFGCSCGLLRPAHQPWRSQSPSISLRSCSIHPRINSSSGVGTTCMNSLPSALHRVIQCWTGGNRQRLSCRSEATPQAHASQTAICPHRQFTIHPKVI